MTQARDVLSTTRRQLPMVKVDKDYVFAGPGRRRAPCRDCSTVVASSSSSTSCSTRVGTKAVPAARGRPTSSPPDCSRTCAPGTRTSSSCPGPRSTRSSGTRRKRGWTFPWYSSFGSDFNYDFNVTIDASVAPVMWNYRTMRRARAGTTWAGSGRDRPSNPATACSFATAAASFTPTPCTRGEPRCSAAPTTSSTDRARSPGGVGGAQGCVPPTSGPPCPISPPDDAWARCGQHHCESRGTTIGRDLGT